MAKLIAISGGIGCGKSIASKILTTLGYPIYDSDSRAKRLMDNSTEIKRRIADEICPDAIVNNNIDRRLLADVVFNDKHKLKQLNAIVHTAVKHDISNWRRQQEQQTSTDKLFVETAILYQSGLDMIVDEIWEVTAPEEICITRAMARDNSRRNQIEARINSQHESRASEMASRQMTETSIPSKSHIIVNDGLTPILPRILCLLHNA